MNDNESDKEKQMISEGDNGKNTGTKGKKKRWFTGLTPRRRKLVENLVSGKFKTQKDALISAGYSESTATKIPQLIIGNYRNQQSMIECMAEKGYDTSFLTDRLGEGLLANKVISAVLITPKGEMAEASGVTKDFIEVPDFPTRHDFLETALKLRGDFPSSKSEGILTIESHEQRIARLKERIIKKL